MRRAPRPKEEWVSLFREDLVIISPELWEKAQERWKALEGIWPISRHGKRAAQQKSYVHTSPRYLLSGLMKCHVCGGAILLVSGKGGGYYGCFNARRKTCRNTLWVSRSRVERAVLSDLQERILTVENLEYVYRQVAKATNEALNEVPALLKQKRAQLEKILSAIRNYLEFIRAGNLSKAVAEALQEAEKQGGDLEQEISALEHQGQRAFEPPAKEWIRCRLGQLRDTLSRNATAAAQVLKELLGTIRLEPVTEKEADPYHVMGEEGYTFKPYYVAHTKIHTLALLDEHQGANSYQWWRRRELHPRLRIESVSPLHA